MRRIRLAVVLFFFVSCACFAAYYGLEWKNADRNAPEIEIEEDALVVNVSATEEELLEGVTAWDEEDGDLTARLQIASLSPFVGKNERTVNYIVFDSADRAATASRTVLYRDYEPPRIYIKSPLCFSTGELSNWLGKLNYQAADVIDGDLTGKVRMSYTTVYGLAAGDHEITFQVNNSAGDTCILPVKMTITDPKEELGKYYPMLSDYVVYVRAGESLEEEKLPVGMIGNGAEYLFEKVKESEGTDSAGAGEDGDGTGADDSERGEQMETSNGIALRDIRVRSYVNYNVPGIYTVEYSYTTEDDITAVTVLYVVVEE